MCNIYFIFSWTVTDLYGIIKVDKKGRLKMKTVTLKITIRNEDEKLDLEVYEVVVKKTDVDDFSDSISVYGITDWLNEHKFTECAGCGKWSEFNEETSDGFCCCHRCSQSGFPRM